MERSGVRRRNQGTNGGRRRVVRKLRGVVKVDQSLCDLSRFWGGLSEMSVKLGRRLSGAGRRGGWKGPAMCFGYGTAQFVKKCLKDQGRTSEGGEGGEKWCRGKKF